MLFRILTLRRHKTVTFCDAYSYELFRSQIMISNSKLENKNLIIGTIIDCQWHYEINKSGNEVVYVDEIKNIILPIKNVSYKSFNLSEENIKLEDVFSNELNGGVKLRRRRWYIELISTIREYLEQQGILMVSTPILCKNRGTSVVNPARVSGEYLGEKYIKITHELELKKLVFSLLAPVFEFGYVVRDRYVTQTGRNEFFTLEGVIPQGVFFDLTKFYLFVIDKSKKIAMDLHLQYNTDFDSIMCIDLKREFEDREKVFSKKAFLNYYKKENEKHKNVIFINAPLDSPLGWQDEFGMPLETQWNYNGHGIGHGYYDEYRVNILLEEFTKQQELLRKKGIDADLPEDFLRYCEYAAVPTFSFNLGIERLWENFFEIDEKDIG